MEEEAEVVEAVATQTVGVPAGGDEPGRIREI